MRSIARLAVVSLLSAAATTGGASAQVVPVRTLPLAQGDQFLTVPSATLGMGGVGTAVTDTLLDPFVNPAAGARVHRSLLFTAPGLFSVSQGLGAGRTLPLGVMLGGDRWFAGVSLAAQQLVAARGAPRALPAVDVFTSIGLTVPRPETLSSRSQHNLYANGYLGRRLGDGRTSLGLAASHAQLDAVSGVDLLYNGAVSLHQEGGMTDLRAGALRELAGDRSLELVLLHQRFGMTHDAVYLDWRWDPELRSGAAEARLEHNEDKTRTWGAHLAYSQPVAEGATRFGLIGTLNYKTHPKIPNYRLMNIPRDPGFTWATALGLGLSRSDQHATVAAEAVLEPIWSETWAEADTAMRAVNGTLIPKGGHTVDNRFRFTNGALRIGVARHEAPVGFQLGLESRLIRYRLRQVDRVAAPDVVRRQRESWIEWTPTWGIGASWESFRVRYAGRVRLGTGRPGVGGTFRLGSPAALASTGDFVVAPSGSLTLEDARVQSHQITLTVPIR